jgi:hypothetical protein
MCATAVTTFPQPFLAHLSKSSSEMTLQTESAYSSEAHQWTVPNGLSAGHVLKLGGSERGGS